MTRPSAGVDIGGTFTDIVIRTESGLIVHKLLSTPHDPSAAMLAGLKEAAAFPLANLGYVAHGSTVATNAILERKGARAALLVTQGLRDLLAIGRQNRPELYALHPTLPPPLIEPDCCFEVPERLDHKGVPLIPLDLAETERILDEIELRHFDAVGVCLLYSYVNPDHERQLRARIVERGILPADRVILSSDILPEFREYERASTVALEAYVRPLVDRYLTRLEAQLETPLRVMQSDGGIVSADHARQRAILLALSGPAAGVIGAQHEARLAGYDQIITLDIGGTSTDVALCPGELILRPESQIDGLPLRTRMLDIETIGAGGGSLAWIDSGGALRVGPASAGADPGPIVYGRGGTQITVSDANAFLGRLDADHFLGGSMRLDIAASQAAFELFARQINLSAEQAALGIIEVANANIERALRRVSVARGFDPRGFTLAAFGGAGGLHACEVAARLSIPRVLIPRYPGVMCALGLLAADIRREYSHAIMRPLDAACLQAVSDAFETLTERAVNELTPQRKDDTPIALAYSLDARYRGQAYELNIPYSTDTPPETAFHQAHERAYGYRLQERPIEIISARVGAVIKASDISAMPEPEHENDGGNALIDAKPIRFTDRVHEARLYDRDQLIPGARIDGAALCFQLDSTTLIPPGWTASVDGFHNLIIEPT